MNKGSWLSLTPFEEGFRGTAWQRRRRCRTLKLSHIYEGTLGGPVAKDRIWFFLAGHKGKIERASEPG
jgi:hypothetical protein